MNLFPHQTAALNETDGFENVAYYHDMGLGKTFTGAEKLVEFGGLRNLVICQKSKVDDWLLHFRENYPSLLVFDGTRKKELVAYLNMHPPNFQAVCVINYDKIWRRPELLKAPCDTLMLDESSLIQNEETKRAKAILKISHDHAILLSGTITSGKYERLWSQAQLLGWNLTKEVYYAHYVDFEWVETDGFFRRQINGYKNVERLKRKLREHGAHFLKTEEVFELPEQTWTDITVQPSKDYRKFLREHLVTVEGHELIGDTPLTMRLYARELCGQYSEAKLEAFHDLLMSTNDRLVIFYNFNEELRKLIEIVGERPKSIVNGSLKDLTNYERESDSVTFVQYAAGSMGLNLQKANKMIFFTPPVSVEQWMQAPKRIHRIGQSQPCFYWRLIVKGSVEEDIYATLAEGKDWTDYLFK